MGKAEVLKGRLGAYTRWAKTSDRTVATAPAREAATKAMQARYEREVDPEGKLAPEDRALRAEAARRAHFARLALLRHLNAKKRAA